MAGSQPCTCDNRKGWRVNRYKCHFSAFNGYKQTYSDFSEIVCESCAGRWRTKARYVESLPHKNV